ncbi:MAG: carbamoyl-phosphate synthase large subunit, partial [Thermoplasmata archaeon]
PLNAENIANILIEKHCDAVLGNVSGQTGLNIIVALDQSQFFKNHNIKVLGTQPEHIAKAEDRELFSSMMLRINEPIAPWHTYHKIEELSEFRDARRFPVVVRASFTLGGSGGGLAKTYAELIEICTEALQQSKKIIIEKSLEGEEEFEFELLRDSQDNCVVVCSMENIDPMGVHTGDSIVVSPSQTLSNNDYQVLRTAAIKIVRALNVIGACNIQFSWNAKTGQYHVIEVNPRTSRSSALASKATGYPIARFSTKLSIGYTLDQLLNPVTGMSYAAFEPAMDYVAVKIPVWPFDKFRTKKRGLGIAMHSTGEVMGLGRTFEEAFMKAFYSAGLKLKLQNPSESALKIPTDKRALAVLGALEKGMAVSKIAKLTRWNPFFIVKLSNIIKAKKQVAEHGLKSLKTAKLAGIGDADLAELLHMNEAEVRKIRIGQGIKAVYKAIDTCGGEYAAVTPYYYSTYHGVENEAVPLAESMLVIGAGPIRIGQGIEFDYSSVHAIQELKAQNYRAIMVNNNPETVSTDFDMSDRLYFEPLNFEYVANIIENENSKGVLIQFGGQTALSVGMELAAYFGKQIIKGTGSEEIEITENRSLFSEYLDRFNIQKAEGSLCYSKHELLESADKIGFPVLIRPSYIIGGAGIEVFYNIGELSRYLERNRISYASAVLVEKFLENAVELDIDVVADGKKVWIIGIIEHIEDAGIHSGDAMMVYPPITITSSELRTIETLITNITIALKIRGLINYQLMLKDGAIYMIEANPRASRTIPFLSKARNIKFARIATRLMLGHELKDIQNYSESRYYVKVPVFPFKRFAGIDYLLGPEMKSTGEVIGAGKVFEEAILKAYDASPYPLPRKGAVLLTVNDKDKKWGVKLAKILSGLNFEIYATRGTLQKLDHEHIKARLAYKVNDKRAPTCYDLIKDHKVEMVINTPMRSNLSFHDGYL